MPDAEQARRDGQLRFAEARLDQALVTIRCTGSGARNVTFNAEALQVARFVGAKLLDADATQAKLLAAAVASGMSRAEAQSTLRSAFRAGMASPAFDGEAQETPRLELPIATFDSVVRVIAEACPIETQRDVAEYVWSRGLPLNSGGGFALPRAGDQKALIAKLAAQFSRETLAGTGLFKRNDDGSPDLSRFGWPAHRWCIPWRSPDGLTQTLERRVIGPCAADTPRWVFAAQRGAKWPLGAELLWPAWKERSRPVIIAEGPGDTLAIRASVFARYARQGRDMSTAPFVIGLASASMSIDAGLSRVCSGHRVVVALDSDAAGEAASQKIIAHFQARRTEAIRTRPPAGCKDWGESLVRHLRRHTTHASELEAERAEREALQSEGSAP